MHYLLMYTLAPDYLERRAALREEHLGLAWAAADRGDLVLGGAVNEPTDLAILMFQGESPEVAERFAQSDPYVRDGLVLRWAVRPWATVVGAGATNPVRPRA